MRKARTRVMGIAVMTSAMVFGGLMVVSADRGVSALSTHITHYHDQSGHAYHSEGNTHTYHEYTHYDVYVTIG